MKHRSKERVDIVSYSIFTLIQLAIVMIAIKIFDDLSFNKLLIVMCLTKAVFAIVNSMYKNKESDSLNAGQEVKIIAIVTIGLASGIIYTCVIWIMYRLLEGLLVNTNLVGLVSYSIIIAYLIDIVPLIISTITEKNDEYNIDLCIEQVNNVIKDYYMESNMKDVTSYGYDGMTSSRGMGDMGDMAGCMQVGIYTDLCTIKSTIVNIRDLSKKFDNRIKKTIKEQVEFILSDFTKIYKGYGASQIISNNAIKSKYKEYLTYVEDNLTSIEEKILDNKLDTLDSALDKLKSFSELNNLEDKYK